MRILIDMGHPAHVHLFKNFIWEMEKRGHVFKVTVRDKDVTSQLLDAYKIPFEIVGKPLHGKFSLFREWIYRTYKIAQIGREINADIYIGVLNPATAFSAWFNRKKSLTFNDTEHAKFAKIITYPFTSHILTPTSYFENIGKKQIRYKGYHGLAALHPNYFTPDPTVLADLGFDVSDNIFLIRFAAFDASHDIKSENFDKCFIPDLINKLEAIGKVVISSEIKLDSTLQKYQYILSPEKYHDLLYFSKVYIGEGSTSAIEAAILGVPSLHFEKLNINGRKSTILPYIGVLNELQTKYSLLYSFCDERDLLLKVEEILSDLDGAKTIWNQRRDTLLDDKIDVTAFMVWFIENYPASFNQLRNNLKFEENFKSFSAEVI